MAIASDGRAQHAVAVGREGERRAAGQVQAGDGRAGGEVDGLAGDVDVIARRRHAAGAPVGGGGPVAAARRADPGLYRPVVIPDSHDGQYAAPAVVVGDQRVAAHAGEADVEILHLLHHAVADDRYRDRPARLAGGDAHAADGGDVVAAGVGGVANRRRRRSSTRTMTSWSYAADRLTVRRASIVPRSRLGDLDVRGVMVTRRLVILNVARRRYG